MAIKHNTKFIVGLTGGIGSGKTTVSGLFKNLGIDVIDADEISRSLVRINSPALGKIKKHFGPSILTLKGDLNRKQLRQIIFDSQEEKQWLENLLHPLIRKKIDSLIIVSSSPYLILSAPLLLENKQYNFVNRVLVIDSPQELQIKRSTVRDKVTEREIEKIIATQMSREDRLARANDVIINDQNIEHLTERVSQLHKSYSAHQRSQQSQQQQ